jgi:hypothetical protein
MPSIAACDEIRWTFGKSKTFTFTAKPDPYQEGAIKAASLANTRLVEQLAASR